MICDEAFTEERWLSACNFHDAPWMIRRIWQDTDHPSTRKGQLFACACARLIWPLLTDERSRRGVEIAEQYVDGLVSQAEVEVAANESREAYRSTQHPSVLSWSCTIAAIAAHSTVNRFNDWKVPNAFRFLNQENPQATVALLRDIFGNPFRPQCINPVWLERNDGTISRIAQSIYDDRAFDRLPILADALEDAGCDNADILAHCRSEGPHVRGCWVIDLLLGKH